jgi:acetyl esterase/lipase
MRTLLPGLALAGACLTIPAAAAPTAAPHSPLIATIAAPAEPGAFPLYPAKAQGDGERWNSFNGQLIVRNVSRPAITPFLPDPAKATGAAVIIAPGGAFKMLSMDNEGWKVARWLAERGIAAFVLKYRLNETPQDDKEFLGLLGKVMAAATRPDANPESISEPRATEDALQALGLVREGAAKWNVDPARVGMMGFSAGAVTILNAAITPGAQRPAFIGLIYGRMTPIDVPADAPPLFNALALDDPLFGRNGFGIIESWTKARRPVELHAYERGGHGYGMGLTGTTTMLMMDEFHAWLKARKLLDKPAN